MVRSSLCFLAVLWCSSVCVLGAAEVGGARAIGISEADLVELGEIRLRLGDPEAHDRVGAINGLINLASQFDRVPQQVEQWIRIAAGDRDPRVAGLAEAWVLNLDRRRRGERAPWTAEREVRFQAELAAFRARLEDPEPMARRQSLNELLHLALSEGRGEDPRVRELFAGALGDPDVRVRSFAGFAISGALGGDESAIHEVHVGTARLPEQ